MATQPAEGLSNSLLGAISQIFRDFGAAIGTVGGVVGFFLAFKDDIPNFWNESSLYVSLPIFGVVCLVTIFAIYAQIIDPLLGRLRQWSFIKLTPETVPCKPVSFRLRPYDQDDHKEYDRPDEAHNDMARWLERADETFLYLTGSSGTGKSSLLQAWLIPTLERAKPPMRTLIARSYADPIGQLIATLKASKIIPAAPPAEKEVDLRALLERVGDVMNAENSRLLIAIDQFEECLLLQDDVAKARLAELFRSLEERPIKRLQFLLVLREDYMRFNDLTALNLPGPRLWENWQRLHAFSHADARLVLDGALPGLNISRRDQVIEEASEVDDLPGLVRPITLNMMGLILKNSAGAAQSKVTPGRLIQDFLRQAMARAGINQLAPRLLANMITDQGTKKPVGEAALAEATGIKPMVVRKTLYDLYEEGVVRELDRSRQIWEISHDFVASQLGQIIPRLKPSLWQRMQKAATPIAIGAWLLILSAGYPTYQIWHEANTAKALRAEGVSVFGEQGKYRVEFDKEKIRHGALERVFHHVEALSPVSLIIRGDDSIASIPNLTGLKSLEELEIWHSDNVLSIDGLESLKNLQRLFIEGNDGLTAIDGLDGLTALRELHIEGNDLIAELNGLEGLESLESIRLEATQVTDLAGLAKLVRLRKVDISANPKLASMSNLSDLTALQDLTIFKNDKLANLSGIEGLESLERLHIYKNANLASVEGLNGLKKLETVIIRFNDKLAISDGFAGLAALRDLHIEDNGGPISLASLAQAHELRRVLIWGNQLKDVPGFDNFLTLESVAIDGSDITASIEAVKNVPSSVQIKASGRYLNAGYAEQLNAARRAVGLDQTRVLIDEQL